MEETRTLRVTTRSLYPIIFICFCLYSVDEQCFKGVEGEHHNQTATVSIILRQFSQTKLCHVTFLHSDARHSLPATYLKINFYGGTVFARFLFGPRP